MAVHPAARQFVLCGPRPHLLIIHTQYKVQNILGCYVYYLLLFFHVLPGDQPIITGVLAAYVFVLVLSSFPPFLQLHIL